MSHDPVRYIDRQTGELCEEQIYGEAAIRLTYGNGILATVLRFIARQYWVSRLYGYLQKTRWSKKKVLPFIRDFAVDSSEFRDPVESFQSFNDFFVRHLRPGARPLAETDAVIPADGRYLVVPNVSAAEQFFVKGQRLSLGELLGDEALAAEYANGSLVLGRLCPTDYHRYHFPCDTNAGTPRLINGPLYSVNPLALRRSIQILSENRRVLTELESDAFGRMLFLEVGATNVGSIRQTFTPGGHYSKGAEKGYFEFGGSAVILLFREKTIRFEADLIEASCNRLEMKCLLGQPLGSVF